MSTDIQGTSTCPTDQEQYKAFNLGGRQYILYHYRREDDKLLTCVAQNLEAARTKRDTWLKKEVPTA